MTTREESPGHPASLVPTHHPLKSTEQIFHEHLLPHYALDPPLAPCTRPPGSCRQCKPSRVLPQVKPGRAAMTPGWLS